MGLHLVILLDGSFEDVHEIFTNFWSKTIFNVMALMNNNGTLLLSFEPFSNPQKCGDTSPKVINHFENGKFSKNLLLKRTFDNMNRCRINVTTFSDGVAIMKVPISNGSFILRGYEIRMINTISKMLNFTLNLKFREGFQQWGIVYENGSATRSFSELKDGTTDILLGNLYLKESRFRYFDNSDTYMNYPIFFVLSPEEKLSSFEKLLSPLQTSVWMMVLLTICIGMVVIVTLNTKLKFLRKFVYGEGVHHPVTNLFAVFIGAPQSVLPQRNFSRFILMKFMILSLVIRSVYQGSLYKFLQSDGRHKEPQSIDELIEKGYTFLISESNVDILRKYHPKMYIRSKLVEGNVENDLDAFAGKTKRTASFASKIEILSYSMQHNEFPYKICKEYFFNINIAMFYNKNFFLKRAIDEALQKILIHGFMEHWTKEFDRTDKWKIKDKNPMVLTVDHLSGAFHVLLIGNMAGIVAVLIENYAYRLK
ncbi:glutamate receptor ionotropic, NMDA 1-like [Chironomus tepperi]|uniref:glutamate receptor ionotropic, NMDA 1-like n=1 Tax=Chironomus tepperi TaxID=113505 RepID=UPI00391F9CC2